MQAPRLHHRPTLLDIRLSIKRKVLLTCATLLISALPMPFPERQIARITQDFLHIQTCFFFFNLIATMTFLRQCTVPLNSAITYKSSIKMPLPKNVL